MSTDDALLVRTSNTRRLRNCCRNQSRSIRSSFRCLPKGGESGSATICKFCLLRCFFNLTGFTMHLSTVVCSRARKRSKRRRAAWIRLRPNSWRRSDDDARPTIRFRFRMSNHRLLLNFSFVVLLVVSRSDTRLSSTRAGRNFARQRRSRYDATRNINVACSTTL
jgi:hypothetical protein